MFTLAQLKEKVIELAEQNPDFVYIPPEGTSRCFYLTGTNGKGCIFGQAIIALDPSTEEYLREASIKGSGILKVIKNLLGEQSDSTIMYWCAVLQQNQDEGLTWNNALLLANDSGNK